MFRCITSLYRYVRIVIAMGYQAITRDITCTQDIRQRLKRPTFLYIAHDTCLQESFACITFRTNIHLFALHVPLTARHQRIKKDILQELSYMPCHTRHTAVRGLYRMGLECVVLSNTVWSAWHRLHSHPCSSKFCGYRTFLSLVFARLYQLLRK